MSVQGKAVQIEPELDNPDPPVPDGAVAVQVVSSPLGQAVQNLEMAE